MHLYEGFLFIYTMYLLLCYTCAGGEIPSRNKLQKGNKAISGVLVVNLE